MGMSKSVMVIVSLVLVVFLALAATKTEASVKKYIDYGAFTNDEINCDKAHKANCKKKEVKNPYTRGCYKTHRCRPESIYI
ncbi:PREDICTED: protein RALF-like 9 [Camelina sativa]|uniref:Protein RALF-like 9 n=1 Tax=Camelina sativa TaxID=90675 RepID=A0ABM1QG98_CAMSA|nr:PREDICTED: protein RALF-like 9 [Camelina sativa]